MPSKAVIPIACGDWTAACEVRQRFMQVLASTSDSPDYSGRCRQACEVGGDCYDFLPLRKADWLPPWETLPARVWPQPS